MSDAYSCEKCITCPQSTTQEFENFVYSAMKIGGIISIGVPIIYTLSKYICYKFHDMLDKIEEKHWDYYR